MPSKPQVLVIDDSPASILTVEGALAGWDCDVVGVSRVADGINHVMRERPACILLDLGLPDGTGFEACKMLRELEPLAGVPIIVYSALDTREDVIRSVSHGATDYIVKPAKVEVIREKVARAIGKDRIASESPIHVEATIERVTVPTAPQLIRKLCQLKSIPQAAMLATSPDSDIDVVIRACRSDPAIASGILRLANSAAYAKRRQIVDLKEAVVRIGVNETRRRVLQMGVYRLAASGAPSDGFDRVSFWRHSVSCALLSQFLVSSATRSSGEEAYLAGLLHDIGKLVLDELLPHQFPKALSHARDDHLSLLEAEHALLGTDHVEVGALLAKEWGLPESIRRAIVSHHGTNTHALEGLDSVTRSVVLANVLAKAFGAGHSGDSQIFEPSRGSSAEFQRFLMSGVDLEARLQSELRRTERFLDLETGALAELTTAKSEEESPKVEKSVAVWLSDSKPASVFEIVLRKSGYDSRRLESLSQWDRSGPLVCHIDGKTRLEEAIPERDPRSTAAIVAIFGRDADPDVTLPEGARVVREPYDVEELPALLEACEA